METMNNVEAPSKTREALKNDFNFILSRNLRLTLKGLSLKVNGNGDKVVRWTDLLEAGLQKITPEDLIRLRAERLQTLSLKN